VKTPIDRLRRERNEWREYKKKMPKRNINQDQPSVKQPFQPSDTAHPRFQEKKLIRSPFPIGPKYTSWNSGSHR